MRAFIRLISFFISIFFSLIVFILISTSSIDIKYSNFKLKNNPKYIVVGHSHPECAFNDSIIPNFKNVASSGESYFYNYIKTKQILKQNPSINVVFIEYTNNQINESMNNWIWGNNYMANKYPEYSSFMNMSDNLMLFDNNNSGYLNALALSTRKKFNRIIKNDFNYYTKIGGYLYFRSDKTDSILNNKNILENKISKLQRNISEVNLSYLDSLISYCKKLEKDIILIRSPQHKEYSGYENEKIYKEILETRYSNIDYIDFSEFPISNSEFGDLEHLNYKGARVFSKWFSTILNINFLKKVNKQNYINKKIKDKFKTSIKNIEVGC